jgi:hypothetical protein
MRAAVVSLLVTSALAGAAAAEPLTPESVASWNSLPYALEARWLQPGRPRSCTARRSCRA